jgi:radical SAM protein with 4Fe4S-binding SPASM domain
VINFNLHALTTAPIQVVIEPTIICNLRCPMCDRTKKKDFESHRNDQLTTEDWLLVIDDLITIGVSQILLIGGGDPLLHPGILKILEKVGKSKIKVHLWTNGTLINSENVNLISENVDILTISMDSGLEQINDLSRGVPGTTKKILNSLELLSRYDVFVRIHAVISALTYKHLDSFFPIFNRYNIQEVGGGLINPWDFAPESFKFTKSDREMRDEILKRFAAKCIDMNINLAGCFRPIMMEKLRSSTSHVSDAGKSIATSTCVGLWTSATIRPNGDVSVCCFTYKPILGSVRFDRFKDVWQSAKAAALRERSLNGEYLDSPCLGCDYASREINIAAHDVTLTPVLKDAIMSSR